MKKVIDASYIKERITIDEPTGCWNWCNNYASGYGTITYNKRQQLAHRVSFQVFRPTEFVEDMCVAHTCDNPRCVNPDHLFIATVAQNNRDCDNKGRRPNTRVRKVPDEVIQLVQKYPHVSSQSWISLFNLDCSVASLNRHKK